MHRQSRQLPMGKVKVCDPALSRALGSQRPLWRLYKERLGYHFVGAQPPPAAVVLTSPGVLQAAAANAAPSALIFLPLPWQEPLSSALAWPLSLILGVIQHCILQPQIKITGPDSALSPEHFDPYLAPPQHFSPRPAEPHQLSPGCTQHPKFHPSAVYSSSLPGQAGGQGSPWPCAATLLLLGWLLTADTPNWGLPASLGAG